MATDKLIYEYLYHRMVAAKMLYCLQHKYTGEMDAAVIFLEESNYGRDIGWPGNYAGSNAKHSFQADLRSFRHGAGRYLAKNSGGHRY